MAESHRPHSAQSACTRPAPSRPIGSLAAVCDAHLQWLCENYWSACCSAERDRAKCCNLCRMACLTYVHLLQHFMVTVLYLTHFIKSSNENVYIKTNLNKTFKYTDNLKCINSRQLIKVSFPATVGKNDT